MTEINYVAVLGAGTMGAGIAGACAQAGCRVLLLDVTQDAANAGKAKLNAGRSPVITEQADLDRIATGSFDELAKIAECDWICEAVVEDLAVKRQLFTRVETARARNSIVTTNTSGIPLRSICAGMPDRLQRNIAVTHFFNPVHVMKLVELVPGARADAQVTATLAEFLASRLGKGVVRAKDTVNFIGNRIGCFWMLLGLHLAGKAARKHAMTIETVDALTSQPLGLPPTGLYGLIDLIGRDVMFNVGRNLKVNLPRGDVGLRFAQFPKDVQHLHARGQLGRKTGGGFYKLTRHEDGAKTMEVFDLTADCWRNAAAVQPPPGEQTLKQLFARDNMRGQFIRDFIGATLYYAADIAPQIADDIVNIDRAMRWGFNWQRGPFEMIDEIGAVTFAEMIKRGGGRLPAMCKVLINAGQSSFYRKKGREYLTFDGRWQRVG